MQRLKLPRRANTSMVLALASYGDDHRVRAEPFEAFELELGRLWKRPESP